jgi:hypothetical protein
MPTTTRTRLSRRLRWIGGAMNAGIALFLGGILIGAVLKEEPILAISLPGFAIAAVAGIIAQFFVLRCRLCHGNLAPLIVRWSGWKVDTHVRCCPYCGASLDEIIPAESPIESREVGDQSSE